VLSVTTGGAVAIQWLKNGAPVIDATNSTLSLTGVALSDAGEYAVVVGGVTSSVTQVAVQAAPQIVAGPESQTVFVGTNVVFTVSTVGSALGFQWQFNAYDIDGATNSSLTLAEVRAADAGSYAVRVSNAVGSVMSAPAGLRVLVPPAVMELLAFQLSPEQLPVFTFNAEPGLRYAIDVSSNLLQWTPAVTFDHAGGIGDFVDEGAAEEKQRFYRLRWVPQ
jgi:hypothetical protein